MFRRASTRIAHNSTIPALGPALGVNHDLKPLQNLITAEKAVLMSLKKLSVDFSKASETLKAWGVGEGIDLGDILGASSSLLKIFSSALVEYASHGDSMRKHLKVIRTKEEFLDNLKRCRRNTSRKAVDADKKLNKMAPDHKNYASQRRSLFDIQQEIRKMDSAIMAEETALCDFKRTATKVWMGLKFGGLVECCQKGTIAGEFGKLAIAEISEETTPPGMPRSLYSDSRVDGLVEEAEECVSTIDLSFTPPAGLRGRDRHNQDSSNTPPASSPQSSHESLGEPQAPPTPTLHSYMHNESNPQANQPFPSRSSGTPVSFVKLPYVSPHQRHLSQGTVHSSFSQTLPSSQQPPSTSTLHGYNESNPQAIQPSRSPVSSKSSLPYVSPHQQHSSFSQTLPPSQQHGVNEGAVNDSGDNVCAATTSSRLATSPVKKLGGYSQDAKSPCGDAPYSDPPPSFDEALLTS